MSRDLELVWVSRTVYSIPVKHIAKRLIKKYAEYLKPWKSFNSGKPSVKSILSTKEENCTLNEKKKAEKWQSQFKLFMESLNELCDLKN